MSLSGWSFPIFSFFVMMPAARCQFAVNLPLQPVQIADPQHQKSDMQWLFEQDFGANLPTKRWFVHFGRGPRSPPHGIHHTACQLLCFTGHRKVNFHIPIPNILGPLRQMVYFGGGPRLVWIKAVLFMQGWLRVYLWWVQGIFGVGLGFVFVYLGFIQGRLKFSLGFILGLFRVCLRSVQGLLRIYLVRFLNLVQGCFNICQG